MFYNNLRSPEDAVVLDTGGRESEQSYAEEIAISLPTLDPEIRHLLFVVAFYQGKERNNRFGQLSEAWLDFFTKNTTWRIDLRPNAPQHAENRACECGMLSRDGNGSGDWRLKALGHSIRGDLSELLPKYAGFPIVSTPSKSWPDRR